MSLSKSLYRSLLRKAFELRHRNCKLVLREPMDVRCWGQGRLVRHDPASVLRQWFDDKVLPEPAVAQLLGEWGVDKRPADAAVEGAEGPGVVEVAEPVTESHSHCSNATRVAATADDTAEGGAPPGDDSSGAASGPPSLPPTSAPLAPGAFDGGLVPAQAVIRAIRQAARYYQSRCTLGAVSEIDVASSSFSALWSMHALVELSLCTSVTTTKGVRVEVSVMREVQSSEQHAKDPPKRKGPRQLVRNPRARAQRAREHQGALCASRECHCVRAGVCVWACCLRE